MFTFSQALCRGTKVEKRLLTTTEAARFLRVSKAFLERDRWAGARIPFIKIGARAVRYEPEALDTYIENQRRRSTTDPGVGGDGQT